MARIVAVVLLCVIFGFGRFHAAEARPLVLGSISSDPSDEMNDWLPFARHLGSELAKDGISKGAVIVAQDVREMVVYFKAGKVDLFIDSPIVMFEVLNATGAKLLARRWKGGNPDYSSVILVRNDSGITSLSALKDKVIAFQKVSSSTGYLLPMAMMKQSGLTLKLMDSGTDRPPAGQVGYLFSGADLNTVAWVFHGRVAAGATSSEDFDKINEEQRAQLTAILETEKIPRHVVAHRGDLPPELVARIKTVLLAMDQTPEGKKVLDSFERTRKFDDISRQEIESLVRYEATLRRVELIK